LNVKPRLEFLLGVPWPGGRLVVEGAGLQAAVQDAEEPVGELAQRCPVAGPAGTGLVVVGESAGRCAQGGEGRDSFLLPGLAVIGLVAA
jgi:hypothetical protein